MTDPKEIEDLNYEEYNSSETTELVNQVETDTNDVSIDEENYTLSKPKRVIIKAVIKNDKS